MIDINNLKKISTIDFYNNRYVPSNQIGIYLFFIDDELVYIGKAGDLRGRILSHLDPLHCFIYRNKGLPQLNLHKINFVSFLISKELYDKEKELIEYFKPRFNKQYNNSYDVDNQELWCDFCKRWHDRNNLCKEEIEYFEKDKAKDADMLTWGR